MLRRDSRLLLFHGSGKYADAIGGVYRVLKYYEFKTSNEQDEQDELENTFNDGKMSREEYKNKKVDE